MYLNPSLCRQLGDGLEKCGWKASKHDFPFEILEFEGTILIFDDLGLPFLSAIKE